MTALAPAFHTIHWSPSFGGRPDLPAIVSAAAAAGFELIGLDLATVDAYVADGEVYLTDEYGPVVYRFDQTGKRTGTFDVPDYFTIANPAAARRLGLRAGRSSSRRRCSSRRGRRSCSRGRSSRRSSRARCGSGLPCGRACCGCGAAPDWSCAGRGCGWGLRSRRSGR